MAARKIPVYKVDSDNNIIARYDSYKDAEAINKLTKNTVTTAVSRRQSLRGYFYVRVDAYKVPDKFYSRKVKIELMSSAGLRIIMESITATANYFDVSNCYMWRLIESGRMYRGYQLRRIE